MTYAVMEHQRPCAETTQLYHLALMLVLPGLQMDLLFNARSYLLRNKFAARTSKYTNQTHLL